MDDDIRWMREALREAKIAFEKDEVPVGAVLVYEGRILARGHNQVELLQDATAHAEILALSSAAASLENWRLQGVSLYCTLEPCMMCAGAMFASRIERLIWGAPDIRVGANGSWIDLFSKNHPIHQVEVTKGVLADECSFLMKEFFQIQRNRKKL